MGLKNWLKGAALATAGLIAPITDTQAQQKPKIPTDMKQHIQEHYDHNEIASSLQLNPDNDNTYDLILIHPLDNVHFPKHDVTALSPLNGEAVYENKNGEIKSSRPTLGEIPENPEDKSERADKGNTTYGQEGMTHGYVTDDGSFATHLVYHGVSAPETVSKEVFYEHIKNGRYTVEESKEQGLFTTRTDGDLHIDYEKSAIDSEKYTTTNLDEFRLFSEEYELKEDRISNIEIDDIESLEPYPDQKVAQQE